MKLSISEAAKMAGVTRATFYRHVEEKGISLEDTDTKRPKVDVSELIRIYGSNLKTLAQVKKDTKNDNTVDNTQLNSSNSLETEAIILRERVKSLETLNAMEKRRLEEQIELLKEALDSEKEERRKATAILTDQRSEKDRAEERERMHQAKLEEMQKAIEEVKRFQTELLAKPKKKKLWPF